MRSAVYLSLALLLCPLMIAALPLPSCLRKSIPTVYFLRLPGSCTLVESCEPVEPIKLRYQARAPDLGPLRRKAGSAGK